MISGYLVCNGYMKAAFNGAYKLNIPVHKTIVTSKTLKYLLKNNPIPPLSLPVLFFVFLFCAVISEVFTVRIVPTFKLPLTKGAQSEIINMDFNEFRQLELEEVYRKITFGGKRMSFAIVQLFIFQLILPAFFIFTLWKSKSADNTSELQSRFAPVCR